MVYHELTMLRQVYFARAAQNKPVRNIVEPLILPSNSLIPRCFGYESKIIIGISVYLFTKIVSELSGSLKLECNVRSMYSMYLFQ